MSDLKEFYQQAYEWLDENCPQSLRSPGKYEDIVFGGRKFTFPSEDSKVWLERMAEKGWTVPGWPKEYGGGGLTPEEEKQLIKAMKKLGCRTPLMNHGIWMLGPALLEHGTHEQKLEHLPKIASGEIRWCQGYSEPGAGSDLASLRCRCDDEGDHFLVNGQKSWTTMGHVSDWIFTLVRTDFDNPVKQAGISFLLIDMETEGVDPQPCILINGGDDFCDVFLDNVKVPKENLVGELNTGWAVAKSLLVHERLMMSQISDYQPKLPYTLVEFAKRYVELGEDGKLKDPLLRAEVTDRLMTEQAIALSHQRSFLEGRAGTLDKRSTTYFKAHATEEDKRRDETLMAILGFAGLGQEGDAFDDTERQVVGQFLLNKSLSIGGGTTEVQLNLVAKALGLPVS